MSEDFTSKLTLEKAAKIDDEMVRDVIKNAKKYTFLDIGQAVRFVGACAVATLSWVGIGDPLQFLNEVSNRVDSHGGAERGSVKIERRSSYQGADIWRNGVYIYKRGELAGFISEPMKEVPHPLLVYRADRRFDWSVWTNAPLEKKIVNIGRPTEQIAFTSFEGAGWGKTKMEKGGA